MLLDIKPLHGSGYNCLEDLFASTAVWLGREYMLMFERCWDFEYQPPGDSTDLLGERIFEGADHYWTSIEKYHGIKGVWYENAENPWELITQEIHEGRPMVINIDAFWIPQAHTYQVQHQNHFILATGYDDAKKEVFYIDPYLSNNLNTISLDILSQSGANYVGLVFEAENRENLNWQEVIRESLIWTSRKKDAGSDCFNSIRLFADEVECSLNIENEIKGYKFESIIPLFFNLFSIGSNRFKYGRFIYYIADSFQLKELTPVRKRFEKLAWDWYEIRSILMKAGRGTINDIGSVKRKLTFILRGIADEEEKLCEAILKNMQI